MSDEKEGHSTLIYYQDKLAELQREKLSWLSKFDQCATQLAAKHAQQQTLKALKLEETDLHRNIVHHQVALLDENLNVIRIDRDRITQEFSDAEQCLRIQELQEEFPREEDRQIPCSKIGNKGTVVNQFNIHHQGAKQKLKGQSTKNEATLRQRKGVALKPTIEDLMKQHIANLRASQQSQAQLMREQIKKLQRLIGEVREREKSTVEGQRAVVEQLKRERKQVQGRYRVLGDKYFAVKLRMKQEYGDMQKQNERLKAIHANLEAKVAEELRVYEKETKAKQTLVLRKSQDFQEDYKARMRAKERTLQVQRENYEAMQQMCIDKINSLERTLQEASSKLKIAQKNKDEIVGQLKSKLRIVEARVAEQTKEKTKLDNILKEKAAEEKRVKQQEKEKEMRLTRSVWTKKGMIEAYKPEKKKTEENAKKTEENVKKIVKPKSKEAKQKEAKRRSDEVSNEQEEDSLEMEDLQKIRKNIAKLESKICHD